MHFPHTDCAAGVDCDMAVGSGGARFKSTVLRHLSEIDSRFPDLIRIVKLWAKAFHLNDAANGTFNTFALTLMVSSGCKTASSSRVHAESGNFCRALTQEIYEANVRQGVLSAFSRFKIVLTAWQDKRDHQCRLSTFQRLVSHTNSLQLQDTNSNYNCEISIHA